jgi:hypothetical protein
MVQAMFKDDVFVQKKKKNSIQVKVRIQSKNLRADIHALLDSESTENFINQTIVNRFKLQTTPLPKVKYVRNIDGTRNSIGSMMHVINLKLQYGTHTEILPFFVINLGTDNMILGYTFLNTTNLRIDWR